MTLNCQPMISLWSRRLAAGQTTIDDDEGGDGAAHPQQERDDGPEDT
jgi:hypothetical protein